MNNEIALVGWEQEEWKHLHMEEHSVNTVVRVSILFRHSSKTQESKMSETFKWDKR